MEAFTLGKPVIECLKGIQELQNEHFLVEAENTATDQWKRNARQFLGYGGVKHLRDARANCFKMVGSPRAA